MGEGRNDRFPRRGPRVHADHLVSVRERARADVNKLKFLPRFTSYRTIFFPAYVPQAGVEKLRYYVCYFYRKCRRAYNNEQNGVWVRATAAVAGGGRGCRRFSSRTFRQGAVSRQNAVYGFALRAKFLTLFVRVLCRTIHKKKVINTQTTRIYPHAIINNNIVCNAVLTLYASR